jgi:hypothetical protein
MNINFQSFLSLPLSLFNPITHCFSQELWHDDGRFSRHTKRSLDREKKRLQRNIWEVLLVAWHEKKRAVRLFEMSSKTVRNELKIFNKAQEIAHREKELARTNLGMNPCKATRLAITQKKSDRRHGTAWQVYVRATATDGNCAKFRR